MIFKAVVNDVIHELGEKKTVHGDYYYEEAIIKDDSGEEWYILPETLEIYKPKRKPDANGVLPLTEEELREFSKMGAIYGKNDIDYIRVDGNVIEVYFDVEDDGISVMTEQVCNYKAILWLTERFELEG